MFVSFSPAGSVDRFEEHRGKMADIKCMSLLLPSAVILELGRLNSIAYYSRWIIRERYTVHKLVNNIRLLRVNYLIEKYRRFN